MRAAVYRATGGSDVLSVEEIETPSPGADEVLVRLHVAGVNPTDWKSRAGSTATLNSEFQIPGQDGAGVIEAVGSGVDPSRVGERVWVYLAAYQRPWGTAAEYTVVPSAFAVALGDASFELGASLGVPALTAYHCLFADGPISGRPVLVAGGAGAVGHAAIEIAKWAGARVVTTVSSEEKAKLAGAADAIVNYRSDDAAEQIRAAFPDGVDRIVEVALGPNLALDIAVAAPGAVITSYAAAPGEATELPVRELMVSGLVLRFMLLYTIPRDGLQEAVEGVSAAVAAGALTTLPLHRFPLADAAGAHDAVEAGAVGKVLIDLT